MKCLAAVVKVMPLWAMLLTAPASRGVAAQAIPMQLGSGMERLNSSKCRLLAEPGDISNSATVWIGLVTDVSRRPLREKSADLARHELATIGGGLPPLAPGAARRPLALVSCDSAERIDPTFQYLIGTLRLPVVIGPEYSGQVLDALTRYTVPSGSALLTVASATALSTVSSEGLFFRTSVHDAYQSKVQARLVSQIIEPGLRASGVIAAGRPMKVFLAHKSDAYGWALADGLAASLRFNGKPVPDNLGNFRRVAYGNRDDPTSVNLQARYESAAREIVAMQPHLVLIVGTTEAEHIISRVEGIWPTRTRFRPRWLVTEGVQSVIAKIASPDDSFASRVIATGPRVNFNSPLARNWLATLKVMYPEVVKNDPRSANALAIYDLVYATAFAIARIGADALTGHHIAAALRNLNRLGAPKVQLGPASILRTFEMIEREEPMNIHGGSGALDWDKRGDVLQDIDILCLSGNESKADAGRHMQPSGLYFDVGKDEFVGHISMCQS